MASDRKETRVETDEKEKEEEQAVADGDDDTGIERATKDKVAGTIGNMPEAPPTQAREEATLAKGSGEDAACEATVISDKTDMEPLLGFEPPNSTVEVTGADYGSLATSRKEKEAGADGRCPYAN